MARCSSLTRKGDQCAASAAPGSAYCFMHDPAHAAERSRNASKAAKAKQAPTELSAIKQELKDLISAVHTGEVARGTAAVMAQLFNVLLRGLEIERRIAEQEELEERLTALEERERNGGRW
jgi:hypothetical protein